MSAVRLVRSLRADGEDWPAGASGTIVEVLDGGRAYVVEFLEPCHGIATVRGDALVNQPA